MTCADALEAQVINPLPAAQDLRENLVRQICRAKKISPSGRNDNGG